MWSNNDGMSQNWMPFELVRRDECAVCFLKKSYVEKLEKVVEAAREELKIIYGHKLEAEQPCKLLQALKSLDEARRG